MAFPTDSSASRPEHDTSKTSPTNAGEGFIRSKTLIERTATIASRSGLHARPAAIFARAATELPVDISLALGTDPTDDCDATSILLLMSLGAGYGDEVILRAEGIHAAESLDHLVHGKGP